MVHPVEESYCSTRRTGFSTFLVVLSLLFLTEFISDFLFAATTRNQYYEYIRQPLTYQSENATTSSAGSTNSTKYAYAFVIGGCNPDKPSYRGYVYDILISARILKGQGSKADVVAFFQLSFAYKGGTELPQQDVGPLTALGVDIHYIPPSAKESFYDTMMDKFRILTLTQYRRVIFLDGDVMPIGNLDFLFELSDDDKYGQGNSTLQSNLVVATSRGPVNGGFFMLTPGSGEYEHVQEIIRTREIKAKSLEEYVKFDYVQGWGHTILEPDYWVNRRGRRGQNWTFEFPYTDQGLLYYWVKYAKKQVSTVFAGHVENMVVDQDGNVVIEKILRDPFREFSKPLLQSRGACRKFMCDFIHFTGRSKPWLGPPPEGLLNMTATQDPTELWWLTLKYLSEDLDMGLNFSNWVDLGRPSLGLYAQYAHLNQRVADANKSRF